MRHTKSAIINIAQSMIDGNIDLLEGCRTLCALCSSTEDLKIVNHSAFDTIRGIDSETEIFPRGELVTYFNPEYLSTMAKEEELYLEKNKDLIIEACKEIVKTLLSSV